MDVQDVKETIATLDLETGKYFLVGCLADLEKGVILSEVEKERFWEQYGHYTENGGNTYISEWTERLKREGKI